jgi:tetratricopeptide (TPR) repeat protein
MTSDYPDEDSMNNQTQDDVYSRIDSLTKTIAVTRSEADLTQLYIERGHCYGRVEDAANSIRDFLSALDTAQRNLDIIHIKSMISLAVAKKDQKEQALFWAMSAVDQDPCNAEGHHTLGLVCDICGFLNLAIKSLQRAICLEKDRWDSVRLLGSCLRENGQIQESIETLSRYVANNPNEPLGLYELAWSLHVCPGQQDRLQMAEEMYEKALKNNPGSELRERIERKLRDIQSITK